MTTIIAGSRTFNNYRLLETTLAKCPWKITQVISGGARGADTLGEKWARQHSVPLTVIRANWDADGASAGYIRNTRMADKAETVILFWDGNSKGTRHMLDIAQYSGMRTILVRF